MATRREGFRKCRVCGKPMNPVEVQVAGRNRTCGKCTRKAHKQVMGELRRH